MTSSPAPDATSRSRIAVVGAGISGLLSAWLLAREHDVTLFEAEARPGGHTHTIDVDDGPDTVPVDTGFIVFNERNYPGFTRLLDLLGVDSKPTEMSFSVQCGRTGLEYRGTSLNTFFAQRRNLLKPRVYRILREILRFHREAPGVLEADVSDDYTLADFLRDGAYGDEFVHSFLLPMAAAVWSSPPGGVTAFPAKRFVAFFRNHGFLQVKGRPQWRVVRGGSRTYVDAMLASFDGRLHLAAPVERIQRSAEEVLVTAEGRPPERFDHVVLGVHSDQALRMLADATEAERAVLSAVPYQENEAVLHADARLMPRARRAWSSWNAYIPPTASDRVTVTYYMNRLQGIETRRPYFVTLNRTDDIDPATIIRRLTYHHPVFEPASASAQRRWEEVNGVRRTWYCGAWWGYGFHEDGVRSAQAVCKRFGVEL